MDYSLDPNVRKAVIRYADDLYIKHLYNLCVKSDETLGGQDIVKVVAVEQSKKGGDKIPVEIFRQVLLKQNRFNSILPRIIYTSVYERSDGKRKCRKRKRDDEINDKS